MIVCPTVSMPSKKGPMTITLTFTVSVEPGMRSETQLGHLVRQETQEPDEAAHEGLPPRPVWRQLLWPWAREYDQRQ